jgi:uncharacterized protein (TIGR03067 family)
MATFDPYHKWLGIPPADQPPNHYRLLGLNLFESDPDVIDVATEQRVAYLRQCATGQHIAESQKLLNEVAAARLCLLSAQKKRDYDQRLRSSLEAAQAAVAQSTTFEVSATMPWDESTEASPKTAGTLAKKPSRRKQTNRIETAQTLATTWKRPAIVIGLLSVVVIGFWLMSGGDDFPRAPNNEGTASTADGAASDPDSERDTTATKKTNSKPAKAVEKVTQASPPNVGDAKSKSKELSEQDAKRLQGRWECVFEEAAGVESTVAEVAAMKKVLTIDVSKLVLQRTINGVSGEYRGTFSLDSDGEQRQFDFTGTGPNGKPVEWLGIYVFEGDVFKLCYRVRAENGPRGDRATTFGTWANSSRVFNKFRRVSESAVDPTKVAVSDVPRRVTLGSGFEHRTAGVRAEMLATGGGTTESERAVAAALNWIARHQSPDGSWNCKTFSSQCKDPSCRKHVAADAKEYSVGATSFGLLPMLAAGMNADTPGPYQNNIRRGLDWMLTKPDSKSGRFGEAMYEHALATITLCEAYGLSKDQKLRAPAQSAVDYIQRAQHSAGGWRYKPNDPGDTSVTGWMLLALRSAQMAGLKVNSQTLGKANSFLKTVARGKSGGLAAYMTNGQASPSMTAIALLGRQFDGAKRSDSAVQEGMNSLIANPPHSMKNCYYTFWATQAMHNLSGAEWTDWNDRARELFIATQIQEGCAAGSWSPEGHKDTAGPLMITSLYALNLEVYYRQRSLYQLDERQAAAEKTLGEPEGVSPRTAANVQGLTPAGSRATVEETPLQAVARRINAERQKQSLNTFAWNNKLAAAAQSQADWMAQVGKMEHLRGKEATNFEDWNKSDHHPVNRIINSGYVEWQKLYSLEVKNGQQVLVAKPGANDNVGEIIAHGNPTSGPGRFDPAVIVAGWMNSPGHRKTILTAPLDEFGVGFKRTPAGDAFWCVVFGKKL